MYIQLRKQEECEYEQSMDMNRTLRFRIPLNQLTPFYFIMLLVAISFLNIQINVDQFTTSTNLNDGFDKKICDKFLRVFKIIVI